MAERCVHELNRALHELFEARDDVYLLGEDLLDPYGGAFKVSQGLSTRWPDRVITTPISEASLVGITAGMAMRGLRPILEIMFGDFVALGFDQIVNGISKFREMYDDQVQLPLVVRLPMGGGRGYGPTHSQSLEKTLIGVPNVRVVAVSEYHDVAGLLKTAVIDDEPVFFVENKLMYGRALKRPDAGYVDELLAREVGEQYPAITFSGSEFADDAVTIATYGGSAALALDTATSLILEHELFCEVVVLSQLQPVAIEPVLESVQRTGALVTLEEGTRTGAIGAEIAASVQETAWGDAPSPRSTCRRRRRDRSGGARPRGGDAADVKRSTRGGPRARGRAGLRRARGSAHARGREHRARAPGRVARGRRAIESRPASLSA